MTICAEHYNDPNSEIFLHCCGEVKLPTTTRHVSTTAVMYFKSSYQTEKKSEEKLNCKIISQNSDVIYINYRLNLLMKVKQNKRRV